MLAAALESGTLKAGISIDILNNLANGAIKNETTRATAISTAAGIPGGLAMLGTIPVDLIQFYAHVSGLLKNWHTYMDIKKLI